MPIPDPTMLSAPTVRQRRIAIELRRLREQAGLSIPEAARMLLGTDPHSWEQLENAERRTSWLVLRRLLDELVITEKDYRSYLLGLLVDDHERACDQLRGWTQEFPSRVVGSVPEYQRMYIGLNAGASEKRMYQPSIVPGILQTRDYAAAIAGQVLRAGKPELAEAVDARVARASRLTDPDPLLAHAVISESALRLQIGGPQVMAGQYQRLRELAELPNVTIQILPLTQPVGAALPAPFVLLDYPRPVGNPGIAYIEHLTRTVFMDHPDEIADYRTAWNRVTAAALDAAASAQFIQAIADGHHPRMEEPHAQPADLA
ncbi:helix-turn-helix domain-containing protein [Rugosimonospora africana]|uniref:Transcriptional regulator n=1 Tax=Rugosimonospora africana TaxID=556532 RepID=A0A8J3R2H5_9ACTN|nr:helix-turn-helix transcriptional regulator [Rugosimonospora africana]GIH21258.1 transcriptional regulator [Rugosimonospora africana]